LLPSSTNITVDLHSTLIQFDWIFACNPESLRRPVNFLKSKDRELKSGAGFNAKAGSILSADQHAGALLM